VNQVRPERKIPPNSAVRRQRLPAMVIEQRMEYLRSRRDNTTLDLDRLVSGVGKPASSPKKPGSHTGEAVSWASSRG
jgi:hypothetical protein